MPLRERTHLRRSSKPALDLPPPFRLVTLREVGDAFAHAISVGIESYRALGVKKQPPLLVADYRRESKSVAVEPINREPDSSLINLVGESAFPSRSPVSTPPPTSPLESGVIVP